MRSGTASPRHDGGLIPPLISPDTGGWPRLLASGLVEAIARHLGARLAALSLDGLVWWPPYELSSGALRIVQEAATAVERERGPVVLDGRPPAPVVAVPLSAGEGRPGSLVVLAPHAGARGAVPGVQALARQAAAALEHARLVDQDRMLQEPVTVVVVDDHTIVREGLRSILEGAGASVVGEAGSAAAALDVIGRSEPDVVLLELKLGRAGPGEGLELCGRINERFPAVGVVVLTASEDQTLVLDALRRGARGYVVKDVDVAGLVDVIRAVKRGESGFDSHSAAAVVRSVASGADARPELSARELEVVRLVATGRTNRQIGEACFISESTVKFHVRHVMAKLGARRRAEVVCAAGRLGLL
jgi:two-component system, NarL family, response regulator DevR